MGLKDLFGNEKQTLQPVLERALQPGEELVGMLMATRRSGLTPKTLALGVTKDRIILVPTSAKDGTEIMSMDRADITGSSAKHMGLALRALSDANVSRVTIQSRTYGEVKLSLILDDLGERFARGGPPPGLAALNDFLASAS
jgi:hypothetical protein